jgi:DNA repair exonuclease SbcCD nuclease subunit
MKIDYSRVKRIFIISDTHFGVRNNSTEWLEIQKDYFRHFFIPLLKREGREGDIVIHSGDTFDSRHSLNLLVMNEGARIMKEISEIMPLVIILGNHDIYRRNSNEVNSVKMLDWLPNIEVYEEPALVKMSGERILLMPWRFSYEESSKCISENPADYLFCHTDVQGMKFNKYTEITDGLDANTFKDFKKVYSGHIHYAQTYKNIRLVGCPYQLTRSDAGNEKGIWLLDLESGEEKYFANNYSPSFVRYLLEGILEKETSEVEELFRNNFVDILINPKWSITFPFSAFSEDFNTYKKLEFIPRLNENEDLTEEEAEEMKEKIDIVSVAEKVVGMSSHPDILKEKILQKVRNLYTLAQREFSQDEEET